MPTLDFGIVLSGPYAALLIKGALTTLLLFAVSWLVAIILALLLTALRASKVRAFEGLVIGYVEYHRNVPALVQLMIWYFGVPQILPEDVQIWVNAHDTEIVFAVIALSLNSAAYMSEDIRSGLRAVPAQQMEAARALGLGFALAMRDVLIPQALRLSMPALVNQTLNLFKATSLAMAIGVSEMTYASRQIENATYRTFETFGVATVFYLLIAFGLMALGASIRRAKAVGR